MSGDASTGQVQQIGIPPRQVRSRRALEKILVSAERVLGEVGVEEFTMAAVAADAGVSVGALYRRFEGKEQLLDAIKDTFLGRLENEVAERLRQGDSSLTDVIDTFTAALISGLAGGHRVFPNLLYGQSGSRPTVQQQRGVEALRTMRQLFDAAVAPHRDEVRRADPDTALSTVQRSIIGACVHRTALAPYLGEETSWESFGTELSEMAITYLLTQERP